jgi:ribosomal protein S27E
MPLPTSSPIPSPRGIVSPESERGLSHASAPPLTVRCSGCKSPLSVPTDARVTTQAQARTIMVSCAACGHTQRVPVAS